MEIIPLFLLYRPATLPPLGVYLTPHPLNRSWLQEQIPAGANAQGSSGCCGMTHPSPLSPEIRDLWVSLETEMCLGTSTAPSRP